VGVQIGLGFLPQRWTRAVRPSWGNRGVGWPQAWLAAAIDYDTDIGMGFGGGVLEGGHGGSLGWG